ncbi:hypothetical protein B0H13DRAFT_2069007, partial [Mycena leptocephala]
MYVQNKYTIRGPIYREVPRHLEAYAYPYYSHRAKPKPAHSRKYTAQPRAGGRGRSADIHARSVPHPPRFHRRPSTFIDGRKYTPASITASANARVRYSPGTHSLLRPTAVSGSAYLRVRAPYAAPDEGKSGTRVRAGLGRAWGRVGGARR